MRTKEARRYELKGSQCVTEWDWEIGMRGVCRGNNLAARPSLLLPTISLFPLYQVPQPRNVIHVLVYSIIMLNTDLHNPAIFPKIQRNESVQLHSPIRFPHLPPHTA